MSPITSHILDTSCGRPAEGVDIILEKQDGANWLKVGEDKTNADGRAKNLLSGELEKVVYRITFETAQYFAAKQQQTFYPYVTIVFEIKEPTEHYHVPLLLNGFGYSTYRGS